MKKKRKKTKKKAAKKSVRKKPTKKRPKRRQLSRPVFSVDASLSLQEENEALKEHIEKLWEFAQASDERLEDLEIHVNLLTRLFTTLCVEKFGMRVGVLKRIIKRVEKEAIRDSQIMHLESLYSLPARSHPKKPGSKKPSKKKDPWDDIS